MADSLTLDGFTESVIAPLIAMQSEKEDTATAVMEGVNNSKLVNDTDTIASGMRDPLGLLNPKSQRQKKKDRINNVMMRRVVLEDWFKNSLNYMKRAADAAGGFIIDLLKFLIFFAMFGEGFLNSLIDWILGIFMMVAQMLIRAIPIAFNALARLIPTLVKMFVQMLPIIISTLKTLLKVLFNDIAPAIGLAFSKIISALYEEFKDVPIIGTFLKFLNWMLDNNAALQKILGVLTIVGLVLAKIGLLGPLFSLLGTVISILGSLLATALGAISLPVLAVIAAIAALTAIFIYAEEIVNWFENSFDKFFEKLGFFGTVLKFLLYYIFPIIPIIRGLAWVFKYLKANSSNISQTLMNIWNKIASVIEFLSSIISKAFDYVVSKVHKIVDWFVNSFDKFFEKLGFFGKILKFLLYYMFPIIPIIRGLVWVFKYLKANSFNISSIIGKAFDYVVSKIYDLFDWFSELPKFLLEKFKSFAKKLGGLFAGEGLMKSITQLFTNLVQKFSDNPLFKRITNMIKEMLVKLSQIFDDMMGSIKGFIWKFTSPVAGKGIEYEEAIKVSQLARYTGEQADTDRVMEVYKKAREGTSGMELEKFAQSQGVTNKQFIEELKKISGKKDSDASIPVLESILSAIKKQQIQAVQADLPSK